MIIALVYLLIILFFIYKNGFFGIFVDKSITPLQFTAFFVFKCLAIPTFYYVYNSQYGGIEEYDAGIFLKDSKIINSIFYSHPWEYIKLLLGFENNVPGNEVYEKYISLSRNWDEGRSWRLFFNDNRSVIRIHSIIHFISFNSYFVHALASCFLGYIGIGLMYRSLKTYFISKEILLFSAFILLPNTWLFSGALLKEPLVLLNLGLIFHFTDRLFTEHYSMPGKILYLALLCFIVYYLKPQVGITVFILYFLFKLIRVIKVKWKSMWYLTTVLVLIVMINFSFSLFKGISMFALINKKQAEFYDVAKGGIFLKDANKFVRVANDPANVIRVNDDTMRIVKGVPYYYWSDSNQKDTLVCTSNVDTITRYKHVYSIDVARSGYAISELKANESAILTLLHSLIRSLGYPYKFSGLLSFVVSLESLLLSICFIVSLIGLFFVKDKSLLLCFMFSFILLLILFGVATPNQGAIVRYRSVIAPFIILSVFYIINHYESPGIRKRDN